ncbi:GAF domain-containing protein [Parvularcula lutaonensis]|uniref:GAF domain-containing protein n=1 Tax=Parvularcula lutaonensis TaxID=491923 RepID=A0ABV7MDQ6_9PROT|nr:GAF domain-containing protein [Parvularcula lutaonensis]GGY53799.1 hypothetical protein GCM10007148_23920 [Parvularcula lutaonensis]
MSKAELYRQTAREIAAVLEGEPNLTARMATVSCLLAQAFPDNIWTGFYLVDPEKERELVVGPYQGTLGCLRIPFDRGVCGAAARTGETQVVHDVHEFEGHIACDSRSVSEIVVPVRTKEGELIAVLDIDSPDVGTFDEVDRENLELIVRETFQR